MLSASIYRLRNEISKKIEMKSIEYQIVDDMNISLGFFDLIFRSLPFFLK